MCAQGASVGTPRSERDLPPSTQAVSRTPKLCLWPPLGRCSQLARCKGVSEFWDPTGCQSCHKVGTLHAALRAFQGSSGYGGRESWPHSGS